MNQISLLRDNAADRKAALEADIYAAGGYSAVGKELGLSDDAKNAATMLSNKVNRSGRHDLKDLEVWQIKQWARERTGRSRLTEFECAELLADLHWVTKEEQIERKEQALETLLEKVHHELQELKAARKVLR